MWMAVVVGVVMAQPSAARRFDEAELRMMFGRRWLVRADGAAAMSFSCLQREAGLWCQAFSFSLRRPAGPDPLADLRARPSVERKKWLDRTRADACKVKEKAREPLERDLCACADDACVWARVVAEVDAQNSTCVLAEPTHYGFELSGPVDAAQLVGDEDAVDGCGWHERRRLSFDENGKLVLELTKERQAAKADPRCDKPTPPAVWVERKDFTFACQGVRLGR